MTTDARGIYLEGWRGYSRRQINPYEDSREGPQRGIWECGWLDARRAAGRECSSDWRKQLGIPTVSPTSLQGANGTPSTQFTLIHPDGRQWQGGSPLKVCAAAQRDLIPPTEALQRIFDGLKMTAEDEKEVQDHLTLVRLAAAHQAANHIGYLDAMDAVEASARKLMGFAS